MTGEPQDTAALLADARLEVSRHKVAAETGVPALLLTAAADEAEMRAHAALVLAWAETRPARRSRSRFRSRSW